MMGFVSENGGGALLNVFPEIEKYITDAIVIPYYSGLRSDMRSRPESAWTVTITSI
jgi:hypothetical protein